VVEMADKIMRLLMPQLVRILFFQQSHLLAGAEEANNQEM
jgi:hypothetical protein